MRDHIKLGLLLTAFALFCILLGYLAVPKAHASTVEPTPRDYQRLNACTNASIRHDVKPQDQVKEAIRCAAFSKAVAHIESAKGTSFYAKTRNNQYGIRRWDNKGRPHIKTYKTLAEGDADFARIYFAYYKGFSYKRFATKWTGEKHIIKAYTSHLSKWVPEYSKMYRFMTEIK